MNTEEAGEFQQPRLLDKMTFRLLYHRSPALLMLFAMSCCKSWTLDRVYGYIKEQRTDVKWPEQAQHKFIMQLKLFESKLRGETRGTVVATRSGLLAHKQHDEEEPRCG